MPPLRLALPLLLAAVPASAEVPKVLADIAPVHSLVAMAMAGVGEPGLIVPAGTAPHDASLRPSEARALSEADIVVWTGPPLVPWLQEPLATLAPGARVVTLLDADGWTPLPAREGPGLGDHRHDEGLDHGGAEGEAVDPHAWLDPAVAAAWLGPIAEALASSDPGNADLYRANARGAAERLAALGDEVRARLAPMEGMAFAVGHDATQYFERAAALPAAWALSPSDGAGTGPRALAALRQAALAGELRCLLVDPETDPALVGTMTEGTRTIVAAIDPEGLRLTPGPDLYPALIEGMVGAVEGCLGT